MPLLRDDALCIRLWDFSETSQTVSLFTREHGVLRGLAKGSKRADARFSGGFDLLCRGDVQAIVKTSGALATLTAWDLTRVYSSLRTNLRSHLAGMVIADVLHLAVRDNDPHPALFDAAVNELEAIDRGDDPAAVCVSMLMVALVEAGYRPELHHDVADRGSPLPDASTYAFSSRLGGLTRDPGVDAERLSLWRVRAETVDVLRAVQRGDRAALIAAPRPASLRALRLLSDYLNAVGVGRSEACQAFVARISRDSSPFPPLGGEVSRGV